MFAGEPPLSKRLRAILDKCQAPVPAARYADASLLAADEQNFMERAYLDELARQLKIDDALKAKLEQQLRDAEGVG